MLRLITHLGRAARAGLAFTLAVLIAGLSTPPATCRAQAPGPDTFAKQPKTPLELWDAVDYLVRTGQAAQAVPYLQAFSKAAPTDADLLQIREKYGVASVLRLAENPATRAAARPILDQINAAVKRNATDPARIERSIGDLSKTHAEQGYAVERLREAGPYAVPALIRALSNPSLTRETRSLIVGNMGRLDTSALPPLIAAMENPDRTVGADAATALSAIGDARAVPFLTYPAASPESSPLRDAARAAIARLTGKPFGVQPRSPLRVLADEAWKYHRHQVKFASNPVEVWVWEGDAPAPSTVPVTVAESILGGRLAREALLLDPADRGAQAALLGFALEKPVERQGIGPIANDANSAFALAMNMGPGPLTTVLNTAIDDGHYELAATAALALGRVAGPDGSGGDDVAGPLVKALSAPDRRVQFAAAKALVDLNPSRPFVGSSRVVPTLARFVASRAPKALVIDGNLNRGNSVAATLKGIGYDVSVATSGNAAFREAAEGADVEVILIDPTTLQGAWDANDTLTNLRGDSATAGIPVFFYGPIGLRDRLGERLTKFRLVDFLVTPTAPALTRDLMGRRLAAMGTRALSPVERAGFSQGAADLIAIVASRPNSPLAADLARAEPALSRALDVPSAALGAAAALGEIPRADAQRNLARVAFDTAKPPALRYAAARALSRSILKFRPLLTPELEKQLVTLLDAEPDANIRGALASVHGALRPSAVAVGNRLRAYQPAPAATAAPTSPPPAAAAKPAEDGKAEAPAEKP